jgi:hypothetical protein
MTTTQQPRRPTATQPRAPRNPDAERVCAILDLAAEHGPDEPILDYPELAALLERSPAARRIAERRQR